MSSYTTHLATRSVKTLSCRHLTVSMLLKESSRSGSDLSAALDLRTPERSLRSAAFSLLLFKSICVNGKEHVLGNVTNSTAGQDLCSYLCNVCRNVRQVGADRLPAKFGQRAVIERDSSERQCVRTGLSLHAEDKHLQKLATQYQYRAYHHRQYLS